MTCVKEKEKEGEEGDTTFFWTTNVTLIMRERERQSLTYVRTAAACFETLARRTKTPQFLPPRQCTVREG